MPRFDNEGFNPDKRINNDSRDRSVPIDENYYGAHPLDKISDAEVRDNQRDIYSFEPVDRAPRNERQQRSDYRAEVDRDYDAERRIHNQERAVQRQQKAKKKKRARRKRKGITALVIILILLLIPVMLVNAVLSKITYDEHKDNPYASASQLRSEPTVKNILLLGVDARKNQDKESSHPDTMMLVSVDMKHRCIKMTSFLRDTWVYIPSRDTNQRLNTANQKVGYSGIVDTIEYNFGVDIDGYVVTNFEMFRDMVDSIGGVEIEVSEKEAKEVTSHPKRYGKVKLKSGKQLLNGKQALAYARIRKIDTDFVRTKRQRTVINSILSTCKKNPLKLYSLANSSAPYIETDLTKSQLKKIAAYASLCIASDMPQSQVPFDGTWKYANIGGASVISIDTEKNKEILIDNIYNKSAKELTAEEE